MTGEEILRFILEVGAELSSAGAETYRVEETLQYIGQATHMGTVEVFATPSGLFVSLTDRKGHFMTGVRRVHNRSIDLGRLIALNALSRDLREHRVTLAEARKRFDDLRRGPPSYGSWWRLLAGGLGSGSFVLLLGGGIRQILVGMVAGVLIYRLRRTTLGGVSGRVGASFIGGATAALLATVASHLGHIPSGTLLTGSIFLLLPGLTFTSGLRDMVAGDLLSAGAHLLEAIILGMAIAGGVAVVLLTWPPLS